MHQSEKQRRGGATAPGSSSSHAAPSRHGTGTGSAKDDCRDNTTEGPAAAATTMPTMPPRAAVNTATSGEEVYDTGGGSSGTSPGGDALTERTERERDHHDGHSRRRHSSRDGRERERDRDRDGSAHRTSNSARAGSAASSSKSKHQHREVATVTALLHERERRVAHLEKDMDIMEREFQRQLDRLSQNESETTTFWQTKYSQLNQQFLRTDTELRLLRNEVEAREEEREELRRGWEVLRREIRERDDDIRGLRGQVRGLKEFVSTSTRTDGQTSDEVFGDGMTRLGNGLQNWVIVNFRKAKMDLTKVDESTLAELGELVPMYEELALTSKVHLLQSLVSAILVEMVFESYYVGLSDEAMAHFRQMEELLLSFTGADEPVNQWRSSTLALIRREAPQRLSNETAAFAERVMARINRLLDAATLPSSTSAGAGAGISTTASNANSSSSLPSETRDAALRVLVNSSIELARLLAVQKAVLRVHMPRILPHHRVPFEAETMEDIGGEDEEALAGREICCVAFPGIIKNGDENGGHLQYRNVITKARVLCSPED